MPGRKNKPFKVREQLDDSFLRRSHRLSLKTEGFKDAKSAREASSVKSPKTSKSSSKKKAKKSSRKSAAEAEEPVPLAIIPSGGLLLPLTCPMRSYKALVKASSRYSQRVSRLHFWDRMTLMIRKPLMSPCALSCIQAQFKSFVNVMHSPPSQFAYWFNKTLECCNWCVDTVGMSL